MKLLKAMRISSALLPAVAMACAAPASSPAPVQAVVEAAAPIIVPDPSFDILVAATDSVLPRFGPPDEKFYINDSLTAKVLDHVGAGARYVMIGRERTVWCDGSTDLTGTLGTMRIYGIYGDSATVAWSATCLKAPRAGETAVAVGGGGTYNMIRAGESWTISGVGLFFEF